VTELELQAYLDKWWGKKRLLIKDYIDSRLGIAKKSGKLFAPPTIDDIHQYLKEHNRQWADGNTAEKFISFYGAKGWMIGKNKMKDWGLALCNNWTVQKEEISNKSLDKYCKCGRMILSSQDKASYGMCSMCHFDKLKKEIAEETGKE